MDLNFQAKGLIEEYTQLRTVSWDHIKPQPPLCPKKKKEDGDFVGKYAKAIFKDNLLAAVTLLSKLAVTGGLTVGVT